MTPKSVDELIAAADLCLRGAKLTGKDRALSALAWAPDVAAWFAGAATLRVLEDSFGDDPCARRRGLAGRPCLRVADGEVARAAAGSRRPGTTVAFAKRDAVAPTATWRRCARRARAGFDATLRLAGGRAAVFHDGTMEIGHALPDEEPRAGIHDRFDRTAGRLARALAGSAWTRAWVRCQVSTAPAVTA